MLKYIVIMRIKKLIVLNMLKINVDIIPRLKLKVVTTDTKAVVRDILKSTFDQSKAIFVNTPKNNIILPRFKTIYWFISCFRNIF